MVSMACGDSSRARVGIPDVMRRPFQHARLSSPGRQPHWEALATSRQDFGDQLASRKRELRLKHADLCVTSHATVITITSSFFHLLYKEVTAAARAI